MIPIALTLIYLIYLSLICQTLVVWDSIGYEQLGAQMLHDGLINYIKSGPQREPLYIFIVALSQFLAKAFSADPRFILKLLHIGILVLTQVLANVAMKGLRIRTWIRTVALVYIGISPVLVNSAMWIYSEIAAVPIVLFIVLCAAKAWEGIHSDPRRSKQLMNGLVLGTSLILAVFVKAIFEAITPLLLLPFIALMVHSRLKKLNHIAISALLVLVSCAVTFYVPVTAYKFANKILNGQYAFTTRGTSALYGNTARRVLPLTPKSLKAAFIYTVNPHFCTALADQSDCDFWSYKVSDTLAAEKEDPLRAMKKPEEWIRRELFHASILKVLEHPFQYAFFALLEPCKMLFWETCKAGQVMYPDWLDNIYSLAWFEPVLVIASALVCAFALIFLICACIRDRSRFFQPQDATRWGLILFIPVMILSFGAAHSFFFVLQRYAIPLAPLWIIAVAFALDSILKTPRPKK